MSGLQEISREIDQSEVLFQVRGRTLVTHSEALLAALSHKRCSGFSQAEMVREGMLLPGMPLLVSPDRIDYGHKKRIN